MCCCHEMIMCLYLSYLHGFWTESNRRPLRFLLLAGMIRYPPDSPSWRCSVADVARKRMGRSGDGLPRGEPLSTTQARGLVSCTRGGPGEANGDRGQQEPLIVKPSEKSPLVNRKISVFFLIPESSLSSPLPLTPPAPPLRRMTTAAALSLLPTSLYRPSSKIYSKRVSFGPPLGIAILLGAIVFFFIQRNPWMNPRGRLARNGFPVMTDGCPEFAECSRKSRI